MRDSLGRFIKGNSGYWLGKKRSEETNRKISIANTGKPGYWNGKTRSQETKDKISKFFKGRPTYRGWHHSLNTRIKMSIAKKGKKSNSWKGGRIGNGQGYIFIFQPNHPFCSSQGYVFEHRLVIEKKLGRYLKPNERVHHINGKKDNNEPENLMAFINESIHQKFENGKEPKRNEIVFDGRKFIHKSEPQ